MSIKGQALSITRGATEVFLLTVRDENKQLFDLSAAPSKLFFTIKRNVSAPEDVRKTSDVVTEIEILPQSDTTLGQAKLFLLPTDTAALEPARDYVYDVWAELPGGIRKTLIKTSRLEIVRGVTEDFS